MVTSKSLYSGQYSISSEPWRKLKCNLSGPGLDNQSLWLDELSSQVRSNQKNLSEVINRNVRSDLHPPGYQILLYFVEKYIGGVWISFLNKKFVLVVQKQFVGAKVWLFKNKVFYECPELPLPYNARPLHSYLKSSKSKDFFTFLPPALLKALRSQRKKLISALSAVLRWIAYFKHAWSPV